MLQSKIRRGELDREITFIRKDIEDGDYNEDKLLSWVMIDTDPIVWARVVDKGGNEVVIADRITSLMKTIFTIDYREDVTRDMRVVFRGRPYEIVSITENGGSRERYLDVTGELIDTEFWT